MTFDVHRIDKLDFNDYEEQTKALESFIQDLLSLFWTSPEGEELLETASETGFWSWRLLEFGYNYLGVNPTTMDVSDVNEILTDLIPRKVNLSSAENADQAVPELVAFWRYLGREFKLPQANAIIEHLEKLRPDLPGIMNDISNSSPAKTFFGMGEAAGYDMTDDADMKRFIQQYQASFDLANPPPAAAAAAEYWRREIEAVPGAKKKSKRTKKNKRKGKMAKESRRKNKKRR